MNRSCRTFLLAFLATWRFIRERKKTRAARPGVDAGDRATRRRVAVSFAADKSRRIACLDTPYGAKAVEQLSRRPVDSRPVPDEKREMNARFDLQRSPTRLAVGLASAESASACGGFAPRIGRFRRRPTLLVSPLSMANPSTFGTLNQTRM